MKKLLSLLLLLCAGTAFSQDAKKAEIAKKIEDYFFLERENIYAHFDKDIFFTNEQIWFKGYVYHRKSGLPFYSTVNIFALLINEQGTIVDRQLLYGNTGIFSGSFKLKDDMPTGNYYVQFYTNWMNNFSEDESFVHPVRIINKALQPSLEGYANSQPTIFVNPESGSLIAGINNSIGIQVSGCNGKPVKADEAYLADAAGSVLKTININQSGYCRFDIIPETGKISKVVVSVAGKKYEELLPPVSASGAVLDVNSYAVPLKTVIKVRTSSAYLKQNAGKPLYLAIHKDEKCAVYEVNFTNNETEQALVIPNSELFSGVNTARLLDGNLKEIATRMFYLYPVGAAENFNLKYTQDANGNIALQGNAGHPNMNLSVTVLPQQTMSLSTTGDIKSGLLVAPYIKNPFTTGAGNLLSEANRRTQYELDLILLNSQSKYTWQHITNDAPKANYTYDIGLSLKGKINQNTPGLSKYKVRVASLSGKFDELVDIDENNEFFLDHLILGDSTKLDFSLVKGNDKKQIKLYPQVFNNLRNFSKQYKPDTKPCVTNMQMPDMPDYLFMGEGIMLDEVELEGGATKLKYKTAFGNAQLRPYKITDVDAKNFFYVTDLIRYHGFDVTINGGKVSITGRSVQTINGQRTTPMVYIDNIMVMSYDILFMMQTGDIDEFYVNQHAVVPGVNNKQGIIKMYMKKGFSADKKAFSPTSFIVSDGFSIMEPFKNVQYGSTGTKGFENFGVIDWEPIIATNEKGEFKFDLPYSEQKQIRVLIEGMGTDGKLISEEKTLTLP